MTAYLVGPTTLVIAPEPVLDFRSAAAFRERCEEHLPKGVMHVVIDFSKTGILDSTGLGAVFALHRQVRAKGGMVAFASPSRPVAVVLQLTKCHKVFGVYDSVDAALASLAPLPKAQMLG